MNSPLNADRYLIRAVPLGTDTLNTCELSLGLRPEQCAYIVDTVTGLASGPYKDCDASAIAAKWNRVYSAVVEQIIRGRLP